jgi:hypothetical protein
MAIDYGQEVDQNFQAFMSALPSILNTKLGKFALLHRGKIVEYFESSIDAFVDGHQRFGPGRFSVQEVTDHVENLGFYSYAGGTGQA